MIGKLIKTFTRSKVKIFLEQIFCFFKKDKVCSISKHNKMLFPAIINFEFGGLIAIKQTNCSPIMGLEIWS
ncbi:hypothetical protein SAR116_0268 [Candidatus Puniceispirillum marinum IMCC1322]|uniref:Uncharacterized protein n=1 Tax=Puniceispirillum marinum (strain IMCC1322) TaxID=488538 RepID=D5BQ13_PUNMI|nr:hypothetical protein SAR116_0268 [Candidatus Puniceispirillum marinum IMCC1322]